MSRTILFAAAGAAAGYFAASKGVFTLYKDAKWSAAIGAGAGFVLARFV